MNLHGVVASAVGAVNPLVPIGIQIAVGETQAADFTRSPAYASPGEFTGSIAGSVLTVTAITSGVLQAGQTLDDETDDVADGTMITAQLTGTAGGVGTYSINKEQTVASETMTTAMTLLGQIQPMTWRDLQMVSGLNMAGVRWKVYISGILNSVVRNELKGGDLITVASGPHQGTWIVAQVLEQFPDWVAAAITLQNGA